MGLSLENVKDMGRNKWVMYAGLGIVAIIFIMYVRQRGKTASVSTLGAPGALVQGPGQINGTQFPGVGPTGSDWENFIGTYSTQTQAILNAIEGMSAAGPPQPGVPPSPMAPPEPPGTIPGSAAGWFRGPTPSTQGGPGFPGPSFSWAWRWTPQYAAANGLSSSPQFGANPGTPGGPGYPGPANSWEWTWLQRIGDLASAPGGADFTVPGMLPIDPRAIPGTPTGPSRAPFGIQATNSYPLFSTGQVAAG